MKTTQFRQRGAAALVVTLLLLFGLSITVFYLNRGLLSDQKTSATQVRSTTAQEIAEAGLEWATGLLNSPYDIGTDCLFLTTTQISFRRRYAQTYWASATPPPATLYESVTAIVPAQKTYPGCKVDGTTLTCSCPALSPATLVVTDPGSAAAAPTNRFGTTNETFTTAALGTAVLPGFTVAFSPVPAAIAPKSPNDRQNDPEAVRVTVTGCTAFVNACAPGTVTGASGPDAVAVVTAIIKLRPMLRAAPAAALTCGRNCAPGGSYNIINTDPSTNGITINAGGTITVSGGASTATIPGLPPQNAQVSADASLSALSSADPTCSGSSMFQAYFGSTVAEYAAVPTTKTIPNCDNANSCGGLMNTAYNDGWRSFYFPDGLALNNSAPFSALGSASDPVTLVTPGSFDINGNISIYGLVFSNSASLNDLGTGTANIYGGIVVCRDQSSNGNGTIAYDPKVMTGARRNSALAVKVPGSWTNSCRVSSANPPVLSCN